MGEFSKKVGEVGEDVVNNFLKLIGWTNIQRNFDIPSINPDKHGSKTHGIDGYFHYKSPMISNTIENVLISIKYSTKPYPNNPIADFKDYYKHLANTIESFKKSDIRNNTINYHNKIETIFDRGIIFWLNNDNTGEKGVFSKLYKIETPKDVVHDGIYLTDNKHVEFIYDAFTYAKIKYPDSKIEFLYFQTGLNSEDREARNGTIMPIQYINTKILPLRIQDMKTNDTTFVLFMMESIQEQDLMKLMGLAKNIGSNLQKNTTICFPDYDRIKHEGMVNNMKQIFSDPTFTDRLSIENYNISFRI